MPRAALLLLPLFVFCTGCMSPAYFRLKPVEDGTRWLAGQQLVHREADEVETVVSFERTWGGYLVFDVVVTNHSDTRILVDPEAFAYTLTVQHRGGERRVDPPVSAVSPEWAIACADRDFGAEQSRYETRAGMEFVGDVLGVVAELASDDSKDHEGEHCREAEERDADAADRAADRAHERTVHDLTEIRNYWASRALRITHVDPGQSVGGKVAMPAEAIARLIPPVGESRLDVRTDTNAKPVPAVLTLRGPLGLATHPIEFRVERL